MNSSACVLVLLCAVSFLATFAHQDSDMLRSKEFLISLEEFKNDTERARRLTAETEVITVAGRGQKGKGSYGGANVVHRRPEKNAAELYRPCFFILSAILGFTFS